MTSTRYGPPTDTQIGHAATRPPAMSERTRLIRLARRLVVRGRELKAPCYTWLLETFLRTLIDLEAAEQRADESVRRLAVAHRRIVELEHQIEVDSFKYVEPTKNRPDSTQEIKRLHGGRR